MASSRSGDIGGADTDALLKIKNMLPNEVNDKLAEYTLEGKWELVVAMYREFPDQTHTAKIRDSIGTALHVAVELNEEKVVEKLVEIITEHEEEALEMVNERGDTALHVAASRELARICKVIVGSNKERVYLVRVKNSEGETPLFQAAVTGSKTAFAYLAHVSKRFLTRDDLVRLGGDSILHLTIRREIFDLAAIIVKRFAFLSTHANDIGITPLAVLATRPTAFRSGSKLSWWRLFLYHSVHVEQVNAKATFKSLLARIEQPQEDRKKYFPINYDTMCSFIKLLVTVFGIVFSGWSKKDKQGTEDPEGGRINKKTLLPPNYATSKRFIKSAYVHAIGLTGFVAIREIVKTKKRHRWSGRVLEALMKYPYEAFTGRGGIPLDWDVDSDMYAAFGQGEPDGTHSDDPSTSSIIRLQTDHHHSPLLDTAKSPSDKDSEEAKSNDTTQNKNQKTSNEKDETKSAFLLAARNGIIEMVSMILEKMPSAIHDTTEVKKKNVLLVAVSNRQTLIVKELMKLKAELRQNLARAVDDDENTVLHLAAHAHGHNNRWQIAGAALQMMWDIKWYEYINGIVPHHYSFRSNKDEKTAGEIFNETHIDLVRDSSEWLKDTAESCSVVAALVAGVSFATATTVPGGTDKGYPVLEGQPAFDAFAVSSLVGLCSSVTGLIMFLAILTSRKEAKDFRRGLPFMLLLGLSSLFVSIMAMFVSFCTGHVYIVDHNYRRILYPFYAATSLPVAFYAMAQFPLYFDLLTAILTKVPRARDKLRHL